MLGRLYKATGDSNEAEQALVKAIRLNPAGWSSYNVLGNILKMTGDYAAALQMYEKALSLSPGHEYISKIRKNIRQLKK